MDDADDDDDDDDDDPSKSKSNPVVCVFPVSTLWDFPHQLPWILHPSLRSRSTCARSAGIISKPYRTAGTFYQAMR